jgi:hypothetical protein
LLSDLAPAKWLLFKGIWLWCHVYTCTAFGFTECRANVYKAVFDLQPVTILVREEFDRAELDIITHEPEKIGIFDLWMILMDGEK